MSDEEVPAESTPASRKRWFRISLAITVLLVIAVAVSLPLAIQSMREVLGRSTDPLFDLETGQKVSPEVAAAAESEATYINLGMIDLDETTGQLTLAVSGNRRCGDACPAMDLTFVSLDDDADQRRGLPPSASISLQPDDVIFSDSVTLPTRGLPTLYPFDQYQLWLGVSGMATGPDGKKLEITPELMRVHATVTLQNRISDMLMADPIPISQEQVRAATDTFGYMAVESLTFTRPVYIKVLAVALVLLIGVSAVMALVTRGLDDLALGIGGLILGVWGVRSVLMPQTIGTITAVDLALSWLILLLLLGLAIRAAIHFHQKSELPAPRIPTRSQTNNTRTSRKN